jgi:hypothetical protein
MHADIVQQAQHLCTFYTSVLCVCVCVSGCVCTENKFRLFGLRFMIHEKTQSVWLLLLVCLTLELLCVVSFTE